MSHDLTVTHCFVMSNTKYPKFPAFHYQPSTQVTLYKKNSIKVCIQEQTIFFVNFSANQLFFTRYQQQKTLMLHLVERYESGNTMTIHCDKLYELLQAIRHDRRGQCGGTR